MLFIFPNLGKCNFQCERIFKPLCGSNGQRYNNECLMKEAACTTKTAIIKVNDGFCTKGNTLFVYGSL